MASFCQLSTLRQTCILCHKLPTFKNLSRCIVHSSSNFQSTVQTEEENKVLTEKKIIIPKRKKKDNLAVLRALSDTVGKDPTASPYHFHDDPYLLPKTPMERKRYLLAGDSGRKAAQLVIKTRPDLFLAHQHDEPKIEAYTPSLKTYVFEEPSEDGIMERLDRLDLKAAAEMHQQLRDAGKAVSLKVSNALLEALCCYNCESPDEVMQLEIKWEKGETTAADAAPPEEEEKEDEAPSPPAVKQPMRRQQETKWRDDNEAQKVFESLEEPDSRSYNTMIRGMVKHGAHNKAFHLFNEMQENGIQTSLEAYNSLISAVVSIREDYKERWEVLVQIMKQMQAENVHPDVYTFNNLLNQLRLLGAIGRKKALSVLSEMRAVNVAPSLGTYNLLLNIFYKDNLPPNDILYDIMDTIEGEHFYYRDPMDVNFFKNAMNVCFNLKDVRLAYRVDALMNTGSNYKLIGDYAKQSLYYAKFLHLICLMDSTDAMFEYYNQFVPSAFIPSSMVYMDMMRSIQTAGTIEKLSEIWKDMCTYGLRFRQEPIDLLIQIMATADSTDKKLLTALADVAKDVQKAFEESKSQRNQMSWNSLGLTNLLMIYIRAEEVETQFCEAFEKECHAHAKETNVALTSDFSGHDLFKSFSQTLPVPEIMNAIAVLKNKGMKLCLLTNNYIDDTDERGLMAAGVLNLRFLFDQVLESCRLGLRKPDPKVFQEACRRLQVQPEEAIFLDDIGPNVKSARALGISTILVKNPKEALEELKELSGVDVFQKALPIACQPGQISEGDVTTKDGVKVHFFEMGQGPPVIFCHGFPEGWYCWRRQMPALAMSGYRAIALEMKGYGESSCPPEKEEYSMDKITRDVISFMDVLGLPQATFIGHDWGGMAVWSLALHYPERTRAVGAFNTPFFPPKKDSKPLENMRKNPKAHAYQVYFQEVGVAEAELGGDLERFFKLLVRAARKEDYFPEYAGINFMTVLEKGGLLIGTPVNPPHSILYNEEELDYALQRIRKSGLRGMLNWYRNINENAEWNSRAVGRKILCPALMVTAEKDFVLTPASSRHMNPWVPNLTRGHLQCGHWSMLERPSEANQILIDWLNKVHSQKSSLMSLL